MNDIGYLFPARNLALGVNSWCPGVTLSLPANLGTFGDNQTR
jgi:hypothetical protein